MEGVFYIVPLLLLAGLSIALGAYAWRHRGFTGAVFDAIQDSVVVLDKEDRVTEINPCALQALGRPRSEVLGRSVRDLYSGFPELLEAIADSGEGNREVTVRDSQGTHRKFEIRISPLTDWRGATSGRILASRDVTERHDHHKRIEELAYRDDLTGLPNRRALHDTAKRALALAHRRQWSVAVLFLDLDRFKAVNDALGHASGDFLLQVITARLKGAVRSEDTLARLGGDEFALLMQDCTPDRAARAGMRLLAALKRPFEIKETILHIEASIGIAIYPEAGRSVDDLLAQADVAMYQAKKSTKSLAFYDQTQDLFTQELLKLESEFRQALESEDLVLEYQPVLDLTTGKLSALEALVRWPHPDRGWLEPADFLHVVEERSLTWALDQYVLKRAISELAPFDIDIAVNLSTNSMLDSDLYSLVEQTLLRHGVEPQRLALEVAERSVASPEGSRPTFERLQKLGVQIAVDDFGTGYSALAYLRRFPLSILKLDHDVVRGIGHRPEDEAIIKAIITIAKSLKLRVIAEGVEHEHQIDWLRSNGCDLAQGYLIARPLPIEELASRLRAGWVF